MGTLDKLIKKVFNGSQVSYKEAERILLNLGFDLEICGSHHVFRKQGYNKTLSIKRRTQLLSYQVKDLKEVLIHHGYNL